jgi:HPt (histidine-containing phosphotransfer) domain-containing protein
MIGEHSRQIFGATMPELANIERRIIDLVHLARQTCGDRDLEREVLALFREQCTKLLAIVAREGQKSEGMRSIHTLKGAARGIGAVGVAECADAVETGRVEWGEGIRRLERAVSEAQATIDRLLAAA